MKTVAFIGTRDLQLVPHTWIDLYKQAVWYAARNDCVCRTGAAQGCDQLAAQLMLEAGGLVELVLPWGRYETEWVQQMLRLYPDRVTGTVYREAEHPLWAASVRTYHPNAANLSQGAFKLHARNYGILSASRLVVALPSKKIGGGGTGQGLRVAEGLGVDCCNLSLPEDRERLKGLLK